MGLFSIFRKSRKARRTYTDEPLDRLTPSGELPFGWVGYRQDIVAQIESELSVLRRERGAAQTNEQYIAALNAYFQYLEDGKRRYYELGECEGKFFEEYAIDSEETNSNLKQLKRLTGTLIDRNYAVAAFISLCRKGKKIGKSNDDYPRYLNYRYGVCDPVNYHKKLIADGYLQEAPPEVALSKFKVNELKTILLEAGLSDKGKKDVLISRVVENIDLNSLNLDKYYIPSELGEKHLEKYSFVLDLPRYGISCEEFDEFKKSYPENYKPRDLIWRILNSRLNENNLNHWYHPARNALFNMGEFLEDEGRLTDALYRYVLVLYYDTYNIEDDLTDDEMELALGIVSSVCKLKAYYTPEIVDRCYTRYRLPNHRICKEDFKKLLFDIFDEKEINIKKYMRKK